MAANGLQYGAMPSVFGCAALDSCQLRLLRGLMSSGVPAIDVINRHFVYAIKPTTRVGLMKKFQEVIKDDAFGSSPQAFCWSIGLEAS